MCHLFLSIGILRRKLPRQELNKALFWQSLRATNLDSFLTLEFCDVNSLNKS